MDLIVTVESIIKEKNFFPDKVSSTLSMKGRGKLSLALSQVEKPTRCLILGIETLILRDFRFILSLYPSG